jgi:hypothetical protein
MSAAVSVAQTVSDDEEEAEVVIQHQQRRTCELCIRRRSHPLFLYLITDSRVALPDVASKYQQYVGLSSQPLIRTRSHNREPGYKVGVKATKAVAPHWELQIVIQVLRNSKHHKQAWKQAKTNRVFFLLKYLCQLSVDQQTPIFAKDTSVIWHILRGETKTLLDHESHPGARLSSIPVGCKCENSDEEMREAEEEEEEYHEEEDAEVVEEDEEEDIGAPD